MTNTASLYGTVLTEPVFDHTISGRNYWSVEFGCKRKSGVDDEVTVKLTEELLSHVDMTVGNTFHVKGCVMTYTTKDDKGVRHLDVYIRANSIHTITEDECSSELYNNTVVVDGVMSKPVNLRKTVMSKRTIADGTLHQTSMFHLPFIAWGSLAVDMSKLKTPANLILTGRMQTRRYKQNVDGNVVEKKVHELSVHKLEAYE